MQKLATYKEITLQERPELQLFIVRWMGESHSETVREIYLAIADFCNRTAHTKVLVDIRRRNVIDSENQDWFYNTFVKSVISNQPIRMAILVTPSRFNASPVETVDTADVKVKAFIDEMNASTWLHQ